MRKRPSKRESETSGARASKRESKRASERDILSGRASEQESNKSREPESGTGEERESESANGRTSEQSARKPPRTRDWERALSSSLRFQILMLSVTWCEEEVSSTTDTDNDRQRRGRLSPGTAIDHRNLETATSKNDSKDRRMTTADEEDIDE